MNADDDIGAKRFLSLEGTDPETSIIIELPILKEKFEEWKERALEKNMTVQGFIEDAVEGHIIRKDIIEYLEKQSTKKPWWKKRTYIL